MVAGRNSALVVGRKFLKFDQIGAGLTYVNFDIVGDLEKCLDLVSWWKFWLGVGLG